MSEETRNSCETFAKYKKIINIYKIISKLIGVERALDVDDVDLKFNVFHFIDYLFVFHYILSVMYIMYTKFEDKMQVLRPLTLCPIAIQVWKKKI